MELTVKSSKLHDELHASATGIALLRPVEPCAGAGFVRHAHRADRAGAGDGGLREPAERRAAPGVAGRDRRVRDHASRRSPPPTRPKTSAQLSGFRLLPAGDQAFDARIALARRAEKTLDVQYYLIAHDASGLQFLRELRDAAARGVRVRILVDDLYAIGQDELLAALAAHANVEVRMFNPLPVRNGGLASRVVFSMHQFSRINGRMHNKLFIADNAFSVTGGRNIADEYFGRSEPANFIDMDILATRPGGARAVQRVRPLLEQRAHLPGAKPGRGVGRAERAPPLRRARASDRQGAPGGRARPARAHQRAKRNSHSGRLEQHFASVQVHADAPAKIDGVNASKLDGTVMSGKLDLVRAAKSDVLVASPYFIPGSHRPGGDEGRDRQQREPDGDDELDRHHRRAAGALRLCALSPRDAEDGRDAVRADAHRRASKSDSMGELHASLGRLHAKLAVVDNRFLFIGSMNMDGRSARWNTEVGLVIDSPELAGEVASLLKRERLPSSYKLRMAGDDQRIEWVAGQDKNEVVHCDEPNATWGQQLQPVAGVGVRRGRPAVMRIGRPPVTAFL